MPEYTQLMQRYVSAYESSDGDAMDEILEHVPENDLMSFLAAVETSLPAVVARDTSSFVAGLVDNGVNGVDAALMARVATTDLASLLTERESELADIAKTFCDSAPSLNAPENAARVGHWLRQIASRTYSPRRLPAEAVTALAVALSTSLDAVQAYIDRAAPAQFAGAALRAGEASTDEAPTSPHVVMRDPVVDPLFGVGEDRN